MDDHGKRHSADEGEGRQAGPEPPVPGDEWTWRIIGAAIAVHRALGPGLLESAYERALAREFDARGIPYRRQVGGAAAYCRAPMENAYRVDFVVAERVVVEVKSAERLLPVHLRQTLTYMRLMGVRLGLLINFNAVTLKKGLRRLIL